jgi:hypothetical protein
MSKKIKGILSIDLWEQLSPRQRESARASGLSPAIAGAADSPVAYPLGPPSISGTTITVDQALAQPTVVLRTIADLAMQKFFADRIFTASGGVDGGAVLFERPNPLNTDLYASRDVQEVAPGNEFPILSFVRGVPMVATPRKIGGKWFVTREARKRNDTALLSRYMRQTANTIRRKTEQMALAEIDSVVTAESRTSAGQSWATAAAVTQLNRSGVNTPAADFLTARKVVELEERGIELNGAIMHPNEYLRLAEIYTPQGVSAFFDSVGITEYFVTPRHASGKITLYATGMVGQWRNEFPLMEETEEEGVASGGRQRTWFQWSISPAMFVDDQFAVLQITGVA